jgi:hypothetical protein
MADIANETHEQTVARVGANIAPRITPDRIAWVITGATYHRLTPTLTVAVLELANGFTVTGESACASPANYNEELGNSIARKQAEAKIWALEGYVLRNKLALVAAGTAPSDPHMATYVGTKAVHALPMTRAAYLGLRGWPLPADEDGSDDGYFIEYASGGKANLAGFTGYVSWSPKDVFEEAYQELGRDLPRPTHEDRMRAELDELSDRLSKLGQFIRHNPIFGTLEPLEQERMTEQYCGMVAYHRALQARVDALG